MKITINKHIIDKPKVFPAEHSDKFEVVEINSFEDFEEIIRNGYTHCVSIFEPPNIRKTDNFVTSYFCYIDIDTPKEQDPDNIRTAAPLDVIKKHPLIQNLAWFIATSPSHTDFAPRYHIYFKFHPDELPATANEFKLIVSKLIKILEFADVEFIDHQCTDAARISFGNSKAEFVLISENNHLQKSLLDDLLETIDNEIDTKDTKQETQMSPEQIEFLLSFIQIRLAYPHWWPLISAVGNTLNNDVLANEIITKYIPNEKPDETLKKLRKRGYKFTQRTIFYYAAICYAITNYKISWNEATANKRRYTRELFEIYKKRFPNSQLPNSTSDNELVTEQKGKYALNEKLIYEITQKQGYKLLKNSYENTDYEIVRINENHLLERADLTEIRNKFTNDDSNIVVNYLTGRNIDEKKSFLRKKIPELITPSWISSFEITKENKLKDTPDTSYFFFKNGVVEITPYTCKLIPYSHFRGYTFWDAEVIKHEIKLPDTQQEMVKFLKDNKKDNYFARYLEDVSTQRLDAFGNEINQYDEMRHIALLDGVGYILHRYKDPVTPKLLYVTETPSLNSERANGRTGKSTLFKLIAKLRKELYINGKNITNLVKSQFVFQELKPFHDYILIDDADKNFDIVELYSILTGSLTIERKFKPSYTIPFEDAPKFAITTNRPTGGANDSDVARRHVIEFQRFFSNDYTPKDHYGIYLLDQFDEKHWQIFYLFAFAIVQRFLKNERKLMQYETETYKLAQLQNKTNTDFVEFVQSIKMGVWYSRTWLNWEWASFIGSERVDDFTAKKLSEYIKEFAEIYSYKIHTIQKRHNNKRDRYILITDKNGEPNSTEFIHYEPARTFVN